MTTNNYYSYIQIKFLDILQDEKFFSKLRRYCKRKENLANNFQKNWKNVWNFLRKVFEKIRSKFRPRKFKETERSIEKMCMFVGNFVKILRIFSVFLKFSVEIEEALKIFQKNCEEILKQFQGDFETFPEKNLNKREDFCQFFTKFFVLDIVYRRSLQKILVI